LREVRASLGLSPYNRSYFQLLPAFLAVLIVTLALKMGFAGMRLQWAVALVASVLAYLVFLGIMLSCRLTADDDLIVKAIWSKIAAAFKRQKTVVLA